MFVNGSKRNEHMIDIQINTKFTPLQILPHFISYEDNYISVSNTFCYYFYLIFVSGDTCLLMDQKEMSNLYRRSSIDASYQVSYHLAKRFQRKSCFRNRPIRNNNCLRRPCLYEPIFGGKHLWKVLY
jgi:hypothetical protein